MSQFPPPPVAMRASADKTPTSSTPSAVPPSAASPSAAAAIPPPIISPRGQRGRPQRAAKMPPMGRGRGRARGGASAPSPVVGGGGAGASSGSPVPPRPPKNKPNSGGAPPPLSPRNKADVDALQATVKAAPPVGDAGSWHKKRAESVAFGGAIPLDGDADFEGWLGMQNKKTKKFEKRFFVLDKPVSLLRHYKTQKDRGKSGAAKVINLFLASAKPAPGTGKHCWQIITRNETFVFKCESQEEMEKWVSTLSELSTAVVEGAIASEQEQEAMIRAAEVKEKEKESETSSNNEEEISAKRESSGETSIDSATNKKEKEEKKRTWTGKPPATGNKDTSVAAVDGAAIEARSARRMSLGVGGLVEYAGREENQKCCDCCIPIDVSCSFVSTTLGVFLCAECARIHRRVLGSEISKVYAVLGGTNLPDSMETFVSASDPMAVTFVGFMGNNRANDYWEAKDTGGSKPKGQNVSKSHREKYIRAKYLQKAFRGKRQGFISVRDEKKKKWRKTWVVVEDSTINLYNDPKDMKAASIIFLASCAVKLMDDPTQPESFALVTPQRTYKLQAQSVPEAIAWGNAIKVAAASTMHTLADDEEEGDGTSLSTTAKAKTRSLSGQKSEAATAEATESGFGVSSDGDKRMQRSTSRLHLQASMVSRRRFTIASPWTSKMLELGSIEDQIEKMLEESEKLAEEIRGSKDQMKALIAQRRAAEMELFDLSPEAKYACPDDELLKDETSGAIIGGSLEALVAYLIQEDADPSFISTFMQTYRTFTSTSRVLMELSKALRSGVPLHPPPTLGIDQCEPIVKRVSSFLEVWLCHHFYDLEGDSDGLSQLIQFVDRSVIGSGLKSYGRTLQTMIRNQMASRLHSVRMVLDSAPESKLSTVGVQGVEVHVDELNLQDMCVEDIDPTEFARQMCIRDHSSFVKIHPREFLVTMAPRSDTSYLQALDETNAPNLKALRESYRAVSQWVLTSIVREEATRRPMLLSRFIQIANECRKLRNFHATMAVMSAVESTCLLRFEGTWEGVSANCIPLLLELRKLISPTEGYKNIKHELYKSMQACIPFVEAYVGDLRELNDFPDVLELPQRVLVNFDKRRSIARIVSEIRRYQAGMYCFHPVPQIQLFLSSIGGRGFDERACDIFARLTELRESQMKTRDDNRGGGISLAERLGAPPAPPSDAPPAPPTDAPPPPPPAV